jgi:hypothetical protein
LLYQPEYEQQYQAGNRRTGPSLDDLRNAVEGAAARGEGKHFNLLANAAVHGAPRSLAVGRDTLGRYLIPEGPVTDGFWFVARAATYGLTSLTDSYITFMTPDLDLRYELLTTFLVNAAGEVEQRLAEARDGNDGVP